MTSHPMKLVTIVCEALAREPVCQVLAEAGAHGYTLFPVEGSGAQGDRVADIEAYGNIQVQVVVQPPVAERILQRLQSEYFPRFAMIVYESDVRVLRQTKF